MPNQTETYSSCKHHTCGMMSNQTETYSSCKHHICGMMSNQTETYSSVNINRIFSKVCRCCTFISSEQTVYHSLLLCLTEIMIPPPQFTFSRYSSLLTKSARQALPLGRKPAHPLGTIQPLSKCHPQAFLPHPACQIQKQALCLQSTPDLDTRCS